MKFTFIESPAFTRYLYKYLNDEEYSTLQNALMENPDMGVLIQGTGGFRKLRWRDKRRGKGKRGGLRIIYYHLEEARQIWLFTLYGKDEAIDLTMEQKRMMKRAITAEKMARKKDERKTGYFR